MFIGIEEGNRESLEQTEKILVDEVKEQLGVQLQDTDIERAHRIGRAERNRT